ncbi:hypothetical protein ARV3_gp18 [Acidianus rod-shaped virus 3]|uniref:Uncharacterized protein n=1 Tax=Acidianus rod-shaped virus 3 TaxID=2730617 RepID=A0A6M3VYI8_9VIRU|nr:hypothetical protein QIT28_gp18 [Acidianus rod-shaped virus 3]QJF12331.1 hypothetical protein ARV3_gp18 [Acidianus rod-shaped virus 3]
MRGEAYGFSQYLSQAIILFRTTDNGAIYQIFIPNFSYYFEFLVEKDPKTKAPMVSDYRIIYPAPVKISDSQIMKELIQDYLQFQAMQMQGSGQNE